MNGALRHQINGYADRRIQRNRIRRRKEIRRNLLLSLLTACIVVSMALSLTGFLSNAKSSNETVSYKYYTSIQVESGETLLSIAGENMGSYYTSAEAYVKEVMRINSLQNEKIIAGQHLIIPYYSENFIG